jgi:hypothetical protein
MDLGGLYYEKPDRFALFYALIFTLKEKRKYKSEKQNESEVKKKKRHHLRNCAFLFSSGNIELSNLDALFDRSRQSLIWEGLIVVIEKLAQIE